MAGRLKILVAGAQAAHKTALVNMLVRLTGAVRLSEDDLRANIAQTLTCGDDGRIELARRAGWLCEVIANAGHVVIAELDCLTFEELEAFGEAFVVCVEALDQGSGVKGWEQLSRRESSHVRVSAGEVGENAGQILDLFESYRREGFS